MFCTIYSLTYTNFFLIINQLFYIVPIASGIGKPKSNIRLVIAAKFIWKSAYEIVLIIVPIELLK